MTCLRLSRRGALCVVLALCAFPLGSPRVVSAAPPLPRLAVHRTPSATDCPDAPSLAAAVEQVMNRRALEPASAGGAPEGAGGAPEGAGSAPEGAGSAPEGAGSAPEGASARSGVAPEFEVHFLRADSTYTAVLQAGGRARQLSSEAGATCDELVGAVALTVAILLDSKPAPPPAPAPAAPAPAPAPVAPSSPRPPRQAPRGDVSLELGAAGTVGMLDPFRPAATADISLRRSAWSAGLGAVWLPRQDIELTSGAVSVGLVAATARGCARILGELDGTRLSACAVSLFGAVHGTGKGFVQDREASAPWLAVGGSAIAEGTLFGGTRTHALGWAARATLLAPVVRARITVERRSGTDAGAAVIEDPALDPSPVGLLVGLSARVSIF
ncbi:hypothetical protein [Sorangium sp. So ce362]|uniref:hypothetical protein n=1 Tax=Sorangium sp. So ce362 TaxID=3133303 RepID=UPI003F5E572A